MIIGKQVNTEIVVGVLSLLRAIILGLLNILEALLENIEIYKRKSTIIHNNTITPSFVLYVVVHYPIALSILAFQLILNSMAV